MNKALPQPVDHNVQLHQQVNFLVKKEGAGGLLAMSHLLAPAAPSSAPTSATASSTAPASSPTSGAVGNAATSAAAAANNVAPAAGAGNQTTTSTSTPTSATKSACSSQSATSPVTCSSPDSTVKAEIPADLRFPDFVDFGYPDFNEIASILGNAITGQEPDANVGPGGGANAATAGGGELVSGMMAKVDSSGMLSLEVPSIGVGSGGGGAGADCEPSELASLQPLQNMTTASSSSPSSASTTASPGPAPAGDGWSSTSPSTTTTASSSSTAAAASSSTNSPHGGDNGSSPWSSSSSDHVVGTPGTPKSGGGGGGGDPSSPPGNADSACSWTQQQQRIQPQPQINKSITGSHLKDLLMGSSCVYQSKKEQAPSGAAAAAATNSTSSSAGNSSLLQLLRSGPAFTPQQQLESHRASMSLAGFTGLNNVLRTQQDLQARKMAATNGGATPPVAFRTTPTPAGLPHLLQHPIPSTTSSPANPAVAAATTSPPNANSNGPAPGAPLIHATKSRPLPPLTKVTVHINNNNHHHSNVGSPPVGEVGFPPGAPAAPGLPTSKTSFGPNVQAPRLSPPSSVGPTTTTPPAGGGGGKHHPPMAMSPVSTTHPGLKSGLTNIVSSGSDVHMSDETGTRCSSSPSSSTTAGKSAAAAVAAAAAAAAAAAVGCRNVSSSGLPGGTPSSKQKNRTRIPNSMKKEGRLHPCTVCTKSFKDRFSLEAHFRIHTGERPFKCGVCGKGFKQKAHMQKHATMHLGVGRVGAPPPRIRREYSRADRKRGKDKSGKKSLPSLNNNAVASNVGGGGVSPLKYDVGGLGGIKVESNYDGIQYNGPGSSEAFSDPSVSTTTLEAGDDIVGCGSTDLKPHLYNGELYRRLTSQSDLSKLPNNPGSLFDPPPPQQQATPNGASTIDYLAYDFAAAAAAAGLGEMKPGGAVVPMDCASPFGDGKDVGDSSSPSLDDFAYAAMSPMKDLLDDFDEHQNPHHHHHVHNPGGGGQHQHHHHHHLHSSLLHHLNNNNNNPKHPSLQHQHEDLPHEITFSVGDVNEDAARRLLVSFYRVSLGGIGDPEDDAYQCQVCRQCYRGKDEIQEHAKTHYRPPSPACILPTPGPGTTTVKLEDLLDAPEHLDAPGNVYYAA